LHLFLDANVGLFFSVNSSGKDGAPGHIRNALFEQFTDRYFPAPPPDGKVDPKVAAEHAQMMVGVYDNSRRMESSFLSLLNLAGPIKVIANEDGTISVPLATNLAGAPTKWREIEPFVWRDVDGKSLLSAQVENGRVVRFSFDGLSPFMVFEPSPGWRSAGWLAPALVAGLVAILLTVLAWPISALVRRHYGVPYRLAGEDAKAHRVVRIGATAALVLFIAWAITVTKMMGSLALLSSSMNGWLWLLQLLSLIVFIGALAAAAWNAMVVVRSSRKWYAKLWAIVLVLSLFVLLWVAFAFNLIAFDVNF
jgi:hypothetical protein